MHGITANYMTDEPLQGPTANPITQQPQTPKTPMTTREWLINRTLIKVRYRAATIIDYMKRDSALAKGSND